jgi:hypothetical protein
MAAVTLHKAISGVRGYNTKATFIIAHSFFTGERN